MLEYVVVDCVLQSRVLYIVMLESMCQEVKRVWQHYNSSMLDASC